MTGKGPTTGPRGGTVVDEAAIDATTVVSSRRMSTISPISKALFFGKRP